MPFLFSSSKTTNSTPTLSPGLQTGQTAALNNLTGIVSDPSAGLAPVQSAAQDSINESYKNLPNTVTSMLAQRGMGSSGAVGTGTYDVEGSRLNSLSQLYSQIAQLASSRQLSADQIINQMIGTGKGETSTTTSNPSVADSLASLGSLLTLGSGSIDPTSIMGKILGTGGGGSSPSSLPIGDPTTLNMGTIDPSVLQVQDPTGAVQDPSGAGWS